MIKRTLNFNDWETKYFDWLKEKTSIKEIDGWVEISTPFLDRHNDGIVIYARTYGDKIELSDDGYTLNDLDSCGIKFNTPNRQALLGATLLKYGVKLQGNELTTDATIDKFAQKKHFLIQAILSVNDMFMLTRNQIANLFLEDLAAFFDDNDIRYSADIQLHGTSGFSHNVDFVIPKSKMKPERLISALNAPTITSAKLALFNLSDVRAARSSDNLAYVFLNDNRKISSSILEAFSAYDVSPVVWSQREKVIPDLVA